MQTIHASYTNIRTSSKLKNSSMKTLKSFVSGLLITNWVFILARIRQNLFFLQVNRQQRISVNYILNITTNIKQHWEVTYLGCVLDRRDDVRRANGIKNYKNKINSKLKFLYRKNRFLSPEHWRILCNALIQPHLIMHVQLNTVILLKKRKRKWKLCKINA